MIYFINLAKNKGRESVIIKNKKWYKIALISQSAKAYWVKEWLEVNATRFLLDDWCKRNGNWLRHLVILKSLAPDKSLLEAEDEVKICDKC